MQLLGELAVRGSARPTNWPPRSEETAALPRAVLPGGRAEASTLTEVEAALAIFDVTEPEPNGTDPAVSAALAPAPAPTAHESVAASVAEPESVAASLAAPEAPALSAESLDRAAELRLDMTAAPDGALELPVRGLSLDDVHADAARLAGPRPVVAFDSQRPIFRKRLRPYQRSVEETLRMERARERREAAFVGAVVFLVLVAAIPTPSSIFLLYAALVGGCVGAASHEMGGGIEVWAAGSLMGTAALLPFAQGREFIVLAAALAISGSLVGFVRSRR